MMADWAISEPKATRVEVVDDRGRVFVQYYETEGIEVHVQDEGHTVKVFARTPRPKVDVDGILAATPEQYWESGEDPWGGANLESPIVVDGVEARPAVVRGKGTFEPNPDWGK